MTTQITWELMKILFRDMTVLLSRLMSKSGILETEFNLFKKRASYIWSIVYKTKKICLNKS